jgi:hypothetical protein
MIEGMNGMMSGIQSGLKSRTIKSIFENGPNTGRRELSTT